MKKRMFSLVIAMCSVTSFMPVTLMASSIPATPLVPATPTSKPVVVVVSRRPSIPHRQTTRPEYVNDKYPRYPVEISVPQHGEIIPSSTRITEDSLVKITVEPEFGYKLDTISAVTRSGSSLTVEYQPDGTYAFRMPDERVDVSATFVLKNNTK